MLTAFGTRLSFEAFQSLGLPIATGHPHEEDGLDDERARECSLEQTHGFFAECVAKDSPL